MDKIKRLITIVIPNQKCNFKCEYCYISQLDAWEEPERSQYSPEHIAKCLSRDRLGGTCLINFTGNGETLLQPDLPDIVKAVLEEGHYVEVVTNGIITKRLEQYLAMDKRLLAHLEFKLSFHYKELAQRNLLDRFFDNVRAIRDAGASFTLELMAYDAIEDDIDDIIDVCMKSAGAVCHATIGRDEHSAKRTLLTNHSKSEFQEIWSPLHSDMMDFKFELLDVKRREFCYAGMWSLFINLYTGETSPCYWLPSNQNVFKNPEKPIKFLPVGHACPQPFCINGHAHLALGMIPELDTPHYDEIRNRACEDGSEWFTPECKRFFHSKLNESNTEMSKLQRAVYTLTEPFRLLFWVLSDPRTPHRFGKLFRRYIVKANKGSRG